MTIKKDADRHYIEDDAGTVAEMTFSSAGDSVIIIDSTYVRDDHRGEGLGKALLISVLDMARASNRRIMPLCPFAKAMLARMPDAGDIVVG